MTDLDDDEEKSVSDQTRVTTTCLLSRRWIAWHKSWRKGHSAREHSKHIEPDWKQQHVTLVVISVADEGGHKQMETMQTNIMQDVLKQSESSLSRL